MLPSYPCLPRKAEQPKAIMCNCLTPPKQANIRSNGPHRFETILLVTLFCPRSMPKSKTLTKIKLKPLQSPFPRRLILCRSIPYQPPTDRIIPIFDFLYCPKNRISGKSRRKGVKHTSIDRRLISGAASSVSSSPSVALPVRLPVGRFLPPVVDGLARYAYRSAITMKRRSYA
jgi:hypothetical protein